jgi:RibD C-terminal domain
MRITSAASPAAATKHSGVVSTRPTIHVRREPRWRIVVRARVGVVAAPPAASVAQQCLRARMLDEIQVHLVPVLLGAGVRLFDHLGMDNTELQILRVVDWPGVTHLRYGVVNRLRT